MENENEVVTNEVEVTEPEVKDEVEEVVEEESSSTAKIVGLTLVCATSLYFAGKAINKYIFKPVISNWKANRAAKKAMKSGDGQTIYINNDDDDSNESHQA